MSKKRKGILGYPNKSKVLFIVNGHSLDSDSDSDDSSDSNYIPDEEISTQSNKRPQISKLIPSKKFKNDIKTVELSSSTKNQSWSEDVPKEILIKIFSNVLKDNIIEIKNLNKVCKSWYNVCNDEFLWRHVNFANKKLNYNKLLNYTINNNKFKFTLTLNLNGLYDLKYDDIEMILKQSVYLKNLSLSDCKKLKSDVLKLIADHSVNLEVLDISSFSTELSPLNASYLFEKLNLKLKKLNLSRNNFKQKVLTSLFTNCQNLEYLDLSNCNSNCKVDLELFIDKCKYLKCFKMINISNACYFEIPKNSIKDNYFKNIEELHYVQINNNSSIIYFISKFCKESLNLKIFDLNGYKGDVSRDEFDNIFDFLNTKNLEYFHITNSNLSNKDCKRLIDIFKRNSSTLKLIDFSWTKISEDNFNEIIQLLISINNKFKIEKFNFSGTCVDHEMIKKLYKNMKTIKEINLSSCRQIDRGMKRLLETDDLIKNFL